MLYCMGTHIKFKGKITNDIVRTLIHNCDQSSAVFAQRNPVNFIAIGYTLQGHILLLTAPRHFPYRRC